MVNHVNQADSFRGSFLCRSQGLPFSACFYDLCKFSARMSPAARYFELPILLHERMIGLIAVCHQSSLVSFQIFLQDGTISASQVFIQKDRGGETGPSGE